MNPNIERIVRKMNEKRDNVGLILIKRFLHRQEFALKLLKNDPKIKEHPKFGFLHACEYIGKISNKKEWGHFFHGRGVRLTNKKTKEVIDFDFGRNGEIGLFDAGWLCNYIRYDIKRLALHPNKYLDFVFIGTWNSILNNLENQGLVKKIKDDIFYVLTKKGRQEN